MDPDTIKDLVDLLIEIGGSLAKQGFELAVKRTYYVGILDVIMALVALGITIFLINLTRKFAKEYDERGSFSSYDLYAAFSGIGAFLTLIPFFILFFEGLDYLFNPQWNAVQMLLGILP